MTSRAKKRRVLSPRERYLIKTFQDAMSNGRVADYLHSDLEDLLARFKEAVT